MVRRASLTGSKRRATPSARFGSPDGRNSKLGATSRPKSRPGVTPPEILKDREYMKKQEQTKAAI